jgi:hypothetical protein
MCQGHPNPRGDPGLDDPSDEMGWTESRSEEENFLVWNLSFRWPKKDDKKSCDFDCETVFKAFLNSEDCKLNITCTIKNFMYTLPTHDAGVKDHHLMGSGKIETDCGTAQYTAFSDSEWFGVSTS